MIRRPSPVKRTGILVGPFCMASRVIGMLLFPVVTLSAQETERPRLSLEAKTGVVWPVSVLGTFDIGEARLRPSPSFSVGLNLDPGLGTVRIEGTFGAAPWSNLKVEEVGCEGSCVSRESRGVYWWMGAELEVGLPGRSDLYAIGGFTSKNWGRQDSEIIGCAPQDLICPAHQYFRPSRDENSLSLGLGFQSTIGTRPVLVEFRDLISSYRDRQGHRSTQHDLVLQVGLVLVLKR